MIVVVVVVVVVVVFLVVFVLLLDNVENAVCLVSTREVFSMMITKKQTLSSKKNIERQSKNISAFER